MATARVEVQLGDNILNDTKYPKYLGVTLDRALTYRTHLENIAIRNNILQKLCGTT